jgi:hypothetical protein
VKEFESITWAESRWTKCSVGWFQELIR